MQRGYGARNDGQREVGASVDVGAAVGDGKGVAGTGRIGLVWREVERKVITRALDENCRACGEGGGGEGEGRESV